jgi:hypothetical protein
MERRHLSKCLGVLFILMAVVMVSCSQEMPKHNADAVGYVNFNNAQSKGADLTAYIAYPDAYGLTWTLTATKADSGSTEGEGSYEDSLLTDSFGPFSVGRWTFALEGFNNNSIKLYEGTVTTTITEGSNNIAITLTPQTEGSGYLVFENCNFDSTIGQSFKVTYGTGNDTLANVPLSECTLREDGLYDVPRIRVGIEAGVQSVKMYVGSTLVHEMLVRIVPRIETVVTYGTFEGLSLFEVNVNEQSAIVEP